MGLVPDSSVLIAAEREKRVAYIALRRVLRNRVPAAKIDANMNKEGLVKATADLLVRITALYSSYALGTRNFRHFRMIPRLQVFPF